MKCSTEHRIRSQEGERIRFMRVCNREEKFETAWHRFPSKNGSGVMGGIHARVVGVRGDDEWVRASRDSLLSVAAAGNTVATSARP